MTQTLKLSLLGVFITGVCLGLIQVYMLESPLVHIYSDISGYIDKGRRLLTEDGMHEFDTFFPLGTAYLYALFFFLMDDPLSLHVLAVFQVLCLAGCHVLIGLSVQELFGNTRLTLATAIASLVYWPLTGQLSFFMSEPFFMCMCLSAQYAYLRVFGSGGLIAALIAGICTGLAIITKTQGLVFLITVLILAGLRFRVLPVRQLLVFISIAVLIMSLHSMHISKLLDRDGFYFSANGAFNMYSGQSGHEATGAYDLNKNLFYLFFNNNSYIDRELKPIRIHFASMLDQEFFMQELVGLWRKDAMRQTLRLGISAFELFTIEPHWPLRNIQAFAEVERFFKTIAVVVIYLPGIIALCVAVRSPDMRWPTLALALPVMGIVCTSALTFGQPRYLIPFMPNILAIAAIGWISLLPQLPQKETESDHPS